MEEEISNGNDIEQMLDISFHNCDMDYKWIQ